MKLGKVYLIPAVISEDTHASVIPPQVRHVLPSLRYFLAEDVRTARRYLSTLKVFESIEPLQFDVLDKKTPAAAVKDLLAPALAGNDMGILSESGCPGVADPGALAVKFAHEQGITVVPLVGPSSLLLALMASGLNGQQFAFHGYLPIDGKAAGQALKNLEKESRAKGQTQMFIETPYRTQSFLQNLLRNLHDDTLVCVAVDVTGSGEYIRTQPVHTWRTQGAQLPKAPAVFLFLAR